MGQDSTAFWAIAVVAFFGFFRLGELLLKSGTAYNSVLHLSWGDISIDSPTNPSMVKVHFKKSKCDQFGAGADVLLVASYVLSLQYWPISTSEGTRLAIFHGQPGETDFQNIVHSRSLGGLQRIRLSRRSICRTQFLHRGGNSGSLSRFGRLAYPDSWEMA